MRVVVALLDIVDGTFQASSGKLSNNRFLCRPELLRCACNVTTLFCISSDGNDVTFPCHDAIVQENETIDGATNR